MITDASSPQRGYQDPGETPGISGLLIIFGILVLLASAMAIVDGFRSGPPVNAAEIVTGLSGVALAILMFAGTAVINRLHSIKLAAVTCAQVLTKPPVSGNTETPSTTQSEPGQPPHPNKLWIICWAELNADMPDISPYSPPPPSSPRQRKSLAKRKEDEADGCVYEVILFLVVAIIVVFGVALGVGGGSSSRHRR